MFAYDDTVLASHPTIRAGVVHATGLRNDAASPALTAAFRAEQAAVAERLRSTPIAELPSIAAWRRVFSRFGAKPTQHRNAAEALLRRLHKRGDVPSISPLVDLGSLVSLRHGLPVAVIDRGGIAGGITVVVAEGTERFTDLGTDIAVHPDPGEVVFVDDDGVVCARRWCWRQSAQSATGLTTTEALIVVEGHHDAAEADVAAAVADLRVLLAAHQPHADVRTWQLSPATPRVG